MKYCRKCGSQIVDYARFCNVCGERTGDNVVINQPQPVEIIQEEIVELKDEKLDSKAGDGIILSIILSTIGLSMMLIYAISLML